MLGIVLLYFLARWIYNLAKKYDKPNKWLYAILAIVVYYASTFIGGVLIAVVVLLIDDDFLLQPNNEFILSLIALPLGIGGVALFRYILKRKWSQETPNSEGLLDESIDEL